MRQNHVDDRAKPTDIWDNNLYYERSQYPEALCMEIIKATEKSII